MNKRITVHVGLDVHKESIEIALADGTAGGEVRHLGRDDKGDNSYGHSWPIERVASSWRIPSWPSNCSHPKAE
jgi:hypothetical protein